MARLTRIARLEARRTERLNDAKLDAVLRARKHYPVDALDTALARAERQYGSLIGPVADRPLRQLFAVIVERSKLLEDARHRTARLAAVVAIAAYERYWLKSPDDWRPRTHNADRQLSHLLRHLFARYDVPGWLDAVWLDAPRRKNPQPKWFIHVGGGGNLRKAVGLPLALTKMMAHHAALAPANLTVTQALRYGQAKALGVDDATTRAVLGSRLGQRFDTDAKEAFWAIVLAFFARHPMIDAQQVGPICDFLHTQKFGDGRQVRGEDGRMHDVAPQQPGLSMTGRDPATLVWQVRQWHRQLARLRWQSYRRPAMAAMHWPSCGLRGFNRVEGTAGNTRCLRVDELLTAHELLSEGDVMRHCVATYVWSCGEGRTAIYSVRVDGERLLTVEVTVATRTVVQVRGKRNVPATAAGERIVRMWASTAALVIGPFAFTRAW